MVSYVLQRQVQMEKCKDKREKRRVKALTWFSFWRVNLFRMVEIWVHEKASGVQNRRIRKTTFFYIYVNGMYKARLSAAIGHNQIKKKRKD